MQTRINVITETLNAWGAAFTGLAGPMLVQSMVVMLVLLALAWAFHRVRAVIRYALLLLVLLKLFLPPSLSLPTGPAYWWPVSKWALPNQSHIATFSTEPQARQPSFATVRLSGAGLVFLIWMAGLMALSAFILGRYRRVSRLEKLPAPAELQKLVDSCREDLELRRSPPLQVSAVCTSPAVCGLFRPVIMIPEALIGRLSFSQFRHVLLHELAHVKRHDLWINHVQVLLQVFYWYNPLLWLANAVIRRVREEAVDEAVTVTLGQEAQRYPETLVAVAKLAVSRPSLNLGFIGITEPKAALKQRLARLIQNPVPRTAKVGWVNLGLILALGGLLLPMAHPESQTKDSVQIRSGERTDTGNILGATDRFADGVVTESAIDKELTKEMEKAGDRASLIKLLQAHGLTFEQYRQKLRRQLIMAAVDAKASNATGRAAITETDINKRLALETALQAQGLTFEQDGQKFRDQLGEYDSKALGFDWFLGNYLLSRGAQTSPGVVASASNVVAKIEIRQIDPTFVTEERIRAAIRSRVGAPESRTDVDSDVRNLYATGLFYNIRVAEERNPEGTVLVYVVQEKPRLSQITFEGNTKIGDKALRDRLASRVGGPLDERKLFQDAQNLQESYRRLGYPDAIVKYKTAVDEKAGRGTAVFQISEGPPSPERP